MAHELHTGVARTNNNNFLPCMINSFLVLGGMKDLPIETVLQTLMRILFKDSTE